MLMITEKKWNSPGCSITSDIWRNTWLDSWNGGAPELSDFRFEQS